MLSAFITALAGPELTEREAAVLARARPCGVILFARNVLDPAQVLRLTVAVRAAIGDDVLILIDQEGGRVQRLRPPHWRTLPAAAVYLPACGGDLAKAARAARIVARLTAADLRALGINTNCAPLIDVPVAGSHDVIGNRAYAHDVTSVSAMGAAVGEGYLAGSVLPVIKHIPGHGRAASDSHHGLPVVSASRLDLDASDFATFRALAHLPAAMTAHVTFSDIDAAAPASTSLLVHEHIIRGVIGFDGLLMSDDLGMKALSGSVAERAKAVLAAGSDIVLACSGDLAETEAVASVSPPLAGKALARYRRARAAIAQQPQPFDVAEAHAVLAEVCNWRPESV